MNSGTVYCQRIKDMINVFSLSNLNKEQMQRFQSEHAAASKNILTETVKDLGDVEGKMFGERKLTPAQTAEAKNTSPASFARLASAVAAMTQQGISKIFPDGKGQYGYG